MVHRWGHWVASSLWPGGRLCSLLIYLQILTKEKIRSSFEREKIRSGFLYDMYEAFDL
jgi:hypothetical protein